MSVSKETLAWYLQKRRRQRAAEDAESPYHWRGVWDHTQTYAVNDGVNVGTDADPYVCTLAITVPSAVSPAQDPAHWKELLDGPEPSEP